MSTVFVHIGQAGNQIGETFWSIAAQQTLQSHQTKTKTPASGSVSASPSPPQSRPLPLPLPLPVPRPRVAFSSPFFHSDGYARAVCVDSEPKVVKELEKLIADSDQDQR